MKTINVKDSRVYGLLALYDLHTDFYVKVLDGISNEAAHARFDTKANHMAWLAGSMLQERFELANWFGGQMQQQHHEIFCDHQGIRDGEKYPPLEDYLADWNKISPRLREIISDLPAEKIDSIFEMEGMKMSHFELLSFDIYREANIIGQLVLWRRLLGFPAMKYD